MRGTLDRLYMDIRAPEVKCQLGDPALSIRIRVNQEL
jgi:hypothetical protein